MAKRVTGGHSGTGAATTNRGWGRAAVKGMVAIFVLIVFSA